MDPAVRKQGEFIMDIEGINSKANAGLTTGIIGTAGVGLGLLGSLLLGNNGMGMNNNSICRQEYAGEMNMMQELAAKDAEIQALKIDQKTDAKILDLYKYVEGNLHAINQKFADQGVWNATAMGGMGSMAAQIAGLQNTCASITKTVVPNTAICPGWGNVTITPEAAA